MSVQELSSAAVYGRAFESGDELTSVFILGLADVTGFGCGFSSPVSLLRAQHDTEYGLGTAVFGGDLHGVCLSVVRWIRPHRRLLAGLALRSCPAPTGFVWRR
jgi:hypothetical protein